MKFPFQAGKPAYDAQAVAQTIQRALASAGLDTQGITLGEGALRGAAQPRGPLPATMPVHSFTAAGGTRRYSLHLPAAGSGTARPVLLMLHGCTQSPEDFAAGTQMNRLADEHGFIAVYPEQTAGANSSKCWNWFEPRDQRRDAGEPALLAGIAREVVQRHGGDPQRVFVAGLSAGAAMAVVLGQTYPDVFAGVGAHSGLPYGCAHDVPSALAAMKGGRSRLPGMPGATARATPQAPAQAVPLIMFHGDRDHTVQHRCGVQTVLQAQGALNAQRARAGEPGLQTTTEDGVAAGGRRFTRTVHRDAQGQAWIESWTVHGAGHAWSGGDARGSYTDATGPDASAEMLRFFLALPRAGTA